MKYNDYRKLEDSLNDALDALNDAYMIETSESEEWSKDFCKILDEIECLRESMIFTFTIED